MNEKKKSSNKHQIKCNSKQEEEEDATMMNVLGLCLLATSLAAASIFSPSPTTQQQQKQAANTIVKEGHRVVVVEYDQDGYQNTKISFSPEQQQPHHKEDFTNIDSSNIMDNTKHKIKEAASVLPNIGQGLSQDSSPFLHSPNPKELICDAYGKCKHKISNAMGKAKDTAQDALEKKKEEAREVRETVSDAVGKAKETVNDKAHDVNEYTKETVEKGKEHIVGNVTGVKDGVKSVVGKIWNKESVETLMGVVNLLGFASGYGMCVWVTFVSSYVLSRAMPRQQFAVVQSKIYPVYFRAMGYCLGIALLGHVLGHGKGHTAADVLQTYNLLASLLAVFVNSVYLEPSATKLMFERMKIEKEEGRGREDITAERNRTEDHHRSTDPKKSSTTTTATATGTAATTGAGTESSPTEGTEHDSVRTKIIKLNNKLKRLNSHSSILNILNLMSLTWHLVYLAQRVHHHSC